MTKIFGIRHHGPGSARRLREALDAMQPDLVLIEGPPDADDVLEWVTTTEMKPPVALLIYRPDEPQRAAYYPFAVYSPEWQAMRYAGEKGIPMRFMDLPLLHQLALQEAEQKESQEALPETVATQPTSEEETSTPMTDVDPDAFDPKRVRQEPFHYLARAAGYTDSELWWEHQFEQRMRVDDSFEAIGEAMQALRESVVPDDSPRERRETLREAWMRQTIRKAEKEGFTNIAVVCGAWHAPALVDLPPAKADQALLKGLSKVKTTATWIPWTYDRLAWRSGYGAGVPSPGWYDHLWHYPEETAVRWLTRVAHLLRDKSMDTSSAHVIEATRLSETLASLRNLTRPGLEELNEAVQTVMAFGDASLLQLIHEELTVGDVLGEVPEEVPRVPLQIDLERQQKSLRLPAKAAEKTYSLDLRKDTDLKRSQLLHRLRLLGIDWGAEQATRGKGTFKEEWSLRWEPALALRVIEQGIWGNTVEEAATQYVRHQTGETDALARVATLLQQTLPADLPGTLEPLMERIDALAAHATDLTQLMVALPPLAQTTRYGDVRKTDTGRLATIIDGLVSRICVGLPVACQSLDQESAQAMRQRLSDVHQALHLLQVESQLDLWQQTLAKLSEAPQIPGVLSGYTTRLLADAQTLPEAEVAQRFSRALSRGQAYTYAADWLEGFLQGSGMILLLDDALWNVLHPWIGGLPADVFQELLPLLRRTFSQFSSSERKQIGEKARSGQSSVLTTTNDEHFDHILAEQTLPVVWQLLGVLS
ncbi:hypothetical protein SAMN05421823_101182 [Catalinimonas alkaloidigena]|uniref:Uncharacterized protein n=1 Tax=Catalinimonas alkaloidigena TaxID=1075417 RepID=A0A1G8WTF8_9BACT|nr:DUF5682 family protein [Catalinimonas alkaloidigena]SDJ81679.1 hypothetical protein SAMN05421823_101182 [Catalinimonas alkaloidigena]